MDNLNPFRIIPFIRPDCAVVSRCLGMLFPVSLTADFDILLAAVDIADDEWRRVIRLLPRN